MAKAILRKVANPCGKFGKKFTPAAAAGHGGDRGILSSMALTPLCSCPASTYCWRREFIGTENRSTRPTSSKYRLRNPDCRDWRRKRYASVPPGRGADRSGP